MPQYQAKYSFKSYDKEPSSALEDVSPAQFVSRQRDYAFEASDDDAARNIAWDYKDKITDGHVRPSAASLDSLMEVREVPLGMRVKQKARV